MVLCLLMTGVKSWSELAWTTCLVTACVGGRACMRLRFMRLTHDLLLQYAVSVVNSGLYRDDADDGEELTYTGDHD